MVAGPSAAAPSPLGPDERRRYRSDGFLVVRGLLTPDEVARVADDADALRGRADLIDPKNLRCRFQPHFETGELLLEAIDPVVEVSDAIAAVAADPRVVGLVSTVLGAPALPFKDKLIYKPPGSNGYALHQDFIAWPGFPRTFTTVVLAIDPSTADNGCIEAFAGAHARGYLSPRDGDFHDIPEHVVADAPLARLELAPGDAVVFGCFLPHRSAPNRSSQGRRQLYLSYSSAREGGELRAAHYADFHRWLAARYAEYGVTDLFFR
jgi:hypothetical protein